MNVIGYILLILGLVGIQRVRQNRASDLIPDALTFTSAVLAGRWDVASGVWSATGPTVAEMFAGTGSDPETPRAAGETLDSIGGPGVALLREARRIGSASGVYVLGKTGPEAYDCSGLVWRALKNLGLYNGPRFTTATIASVHRQFSVEVTGETPQPGDIVLWVGRGHMGIAESATRQYAAKSPESGIGSQGIPGNVRLFRVVGNGR